MSETNDVPAPERKKPLRNPKKPMMQKKIKFASEMDLWNLEDDDEPLQLETARIDTRRASFLPPAPEMITEIREIDEAEAEAEAEAEVEAEVEEREIITTEELEPKPTIKKAEVSPPIRHPKDTPVKSSKARFDETSKKDLPQAHQNSKGINNDLWGDLDGKDEIEMTPNLRVVDEILEEQAPVIEPEPVDNEPEPVDSEPEPVDNESEPIDIELKDDTRSVSPELSSHSNLSNSLEPSAESVKEKDDKVELTDTKVEKTKKISFIASLSKLEKIASLVFLTLFLTLVVAAKIYFDRNVKEEKDLYARPDFPVKGLFVTVDNMDSYWREPIRVGKDADPVQLKVISIAEVRITLPKSSPKSGALRVKFYDGQGSAIGDTVTKSLNSGSFEKDYEGKFACTAGFTSPEEVDNYLANVNKPWRVEVYESSRQDAPLSEYTLLFSAPISTNQK